MTKSKTEKTPTPIKVEYVSEEERFSDDFKPPATFFIVDATGQGVYFHTRDRSKAQQECDKLYSKGKYLVRAEIRCNLR